MKSAEEEVGGAAGRIDHPHTLVAERLDGRRKCAVQDEFLDELRCLEQRVALLRLVRKILVKVAEETGVEIRVAEIVDQWGVLQILTGFGIKLLPKFEQQLRSVTAEAKAPDRIVSIIKKR